MKNFNILFVDDDRDILELVNNYLSRHNYNIHVVDNAMKAMDLVIDGNYDLVFTDYKMPDVNGLELLADIKEKRPETVVVMVTGHGTMESAIEAMRFGSYDYIQKPFKLEVLRLLIDRVYEDKQLADETVAIRSRVKPRHRYAELIGMNVKMQEIYETIDRMKDGSPNVLIQGEIGTGKQLAAQVIHQHSDRRERPLIPVKCAGLAAGRSEAETDRQIADLFVSAAGGAVYFDEITEIPMAAQETILRACLQKTIKHASSDKTITVNVRMIAASHQDFSEPSIGQALHGELLKHLGAVSIKMPPLRERKEDICPLTIGFLDRIHAQAGKKIAGISTDVMDALLSYQWPGNIIQLENALERAVVMGTESILRVEDLPPELRLSARVSKGG